MELAKPALDVGMFTNQLDPQLAFWQQEALLPFDELLPLGGGLRQHRHRIGDTIFKLNHSREALPRAPESGIRALTIRLPEIGSVQTLTDPDGNIVHLEPGEQPQLRVHLIANDLDAHRQFYGQALGLPEPESGVFAVGSSQIEIQQGSANTNVEQRAIGYRYMTLQVFDVVAAHTHVLSKGGAEGRPPIKLGDVAHISFVRDPDGNWLELSQRKSIVGTL